LLLVEILEAGAAFDRMCVRRQGTCWPLWRHCAVLQIE
jgi:hypothetical protein